MEIELDEGIEKRTVEPMDATGWFKQLQEAVHEGLLSSSEINRLLDDPLLFLVEYTNSTLIANTLHTKILRSFFVSALEMKEKREDVRTVLTKQSLDLINERMLRETDSISIVDLSIIYKNLNKES